jgi:hypothetical protein
LFPNAKYAAPASSASTGYTIHARRFIAGWISAGRRPA